MASFELKSLRAQGFYELQLNFSGAFTLINLCTLTAPHILAAVKEENYI